MNVFNTLCHWVKHCLLPSISFSWIICQLIPSYEFFLMETIKTNIIGTDNILTATVDEGVEAVIHLSN